MPIGTDPKVFCALNSALCSAVAATSGFAWSVPASSSGPLVNRAIADGELRSLQAAGYDTLCRGAPSSWSRASAGVVTAHFDEYVRIITMKTQPSVFEMNHRGDWGSTTFNPELFLVAEYFLAFLRHSPRYRPVLARILLPRMETRTEGLLTSLILLQAKYLEPSFLRWATGALLWYIGQTPRLPDAKEYIHLGQHVLARLLSVMVTPEFDRSARDAVVWACTDYVPSNAALRAKVCGVAVWSSSAEETGVLPPFNDATYTPEGQRVKELLLRICLAGREVDG